MPPSHHWQRLDGLKLYRILGLDPRDATPAAVKRAFQRLARARHPDKGGSAAEFAALREAFETLHDPKRRVVYDLQANESALWSSHGDTEHEEGFPGAEDALLRELSASGVVCDPRTQLVLLCAMCARPATKECWTCGMAICSFCTRRQHARGDLGMHWPLVNAPGRMLEVLGRQEMERKRLEDAYAYELELPGYRPQHVLRIEREFRQAAAAVYGAAAEGAHHTRRYDLRLARHYLWAQTHASILLAAYLPTGAPGQQLQVECSAAGLRVLPAGAPPAVIDRAWSGPVDAAAGAETWVAQEGRLLALRVAKGVPGQAWRTLFSGDPAGARCLQPPYTLVEAEGEAMMTLPLPKWVVPEEDVEVHISPEGVRVAVDGWGRLERAFWRPAEDQGFEAVDVASSSWWVEDEAPAALEGKRGGSGGRGGPEAASAKVLTLCLARPALTQEERQFRKGVRQDHRTAGRSDKLLAPHERGVCLFADDEDDFALAPVLQALCFQEEGAAFVPAAPWQAGSLPHVVRQERLLPTGAAQHLAWLRDSAADGVAGATAAAALTPAGSSGR